MSLTSSTINQAVIPADTPSLPAKRRQDPRSLRKVGRSDATSGIKPILTAINTAMLTEAKIEFRISGHDGSTISEMLSCLHLTEHYYRLNSIPTRTDDVSVGDIIYAKPDEGDAFGPPVFCHAIVKSGNRTLRLTADETERDFRKLQWITNELVLAGCNFVGNDNTLRCFNVPNTVRPIMVGKLLNAVSATWDWSDRGK